MASLNRRQFIELGTAGFLLGAVGSPLVHHPFFRRSVQAAYAGGSPKKLLIIFLRGGLDGLHAVIPHGDDDYSPVARPTLYINPTQSIDLNGFCALHPALSALTEPYLAGDLAVLHRIGYTGQSRSHFSSQQYWENAFPGAVTLEEGWANRLIDSDTDLDAHPMPGASVSTGLQVLFRGDRPMAHIPDLNRYTIGDTDYDLKLLGAVPGGGDAGSGLLGVYGRAPDDTDYDDLLRGTGLTLGTNLDHLAATGVDPASYSPTGGAVYPTGSAFFDRVRQAAQLLKQTDCRVIGIEQNGYDSHSNQGTLTGFIPDRLGDLGLALQSLRRDLEDSVWDDTLVITLTEFGRTSDENGSIGTDHGESSVMFAAGGAVNGGVYNCDPTTWSTGDIYSTPNARYVAHRTDFRGVLAEVIDRHFGLAPELDAIIPNWSTLSDLDTTYDPLGFLP